MGDRPCPCPKAGCVLDQQDYSSMGLGCDLCRYIVPDAWLVLVTAGMLQAWHYDWLLMDMSACQTLASCNVFCTLWTALPL